jgi:hypothetical protein
MRPRTRNPFFPIRRLYNAVLTDMPRSLSLNPAHDEDYLCRPICTYIYSSINSGNVIISRRMREGHKKRGARESHVAQRETDKFT